MEERDINKCFCDSILLSVCYRSLPEDPVENSHTIKKIGAPVSRKKYSSLCSSIEQLGLAVEEVLSQSSK
jgi:hypothetical protein